MTFWKPKPTPPNPWGAREALAAQVLHVYAMLGRCRSNEAERLDLVDLPLSPDAAAALLALGVSKQLSSMEARIMADLKRLTDDVANVKGIELSAIALIKGMADKIRNTPPDQAALDQLAADLEDGAANLGAAVAANQPPAPTPPVSATAPAPQGASSDPALAPASAPAAVADVSG